MARIPCQQDPSRLLVRDQCGIEQRRLTRTGDPLFTIEREDGNEGQPDGSAAHREMTRDFGVVIPETK